MYDLGAQPIASSNKLRFGFCGGRRTRDPGDDDDDYIIIIATIMIITCLGNCMRIPDWAWLVDLVHFRIGIVHQLSISSWRLKDTNAWW